MESRILRECYAWKKKVPDKIKNAPDLLLGLEFYFRAFVDLTTCRSSGWSPGPIPWTDIHGYAIMNGLDEEEADTLHHHISKMDNAYLTQIEQKNKNNA